MGKKEQVAGGQPLEWTVSPWRTNWKRPALALAVCFATALLLGFTFNYPNYTASGDYDPQPGAETDETYVLPSPAEQAAQQAADQAYRAHWVGRAIVWSGFSFLILVLGTLVIYLPVRYRLDDKAVTTFFLWVPTARPWGHYRNYYVHDTGVHLTTMPEPSALDPFRGHYLQFAGNRDEVVAFIAGKIKRPEKPKQESKKP